MLNIFLCSLLVFINMNLKNNMAGESNNATLMYYHKMCPFQERMFSIKLF